MIQSTSNTVRPIATLTRDRLSKMVKFALLVWLPVTFGLISGGDSFGIGNSSVLLSPIFVLSAYPIIAIMAAFVACIVNYFGNARKASLVLAFPGFIGAFIVSLIPMIVLGAPAVKNGPLVWIIGCVLSLSAAYCFVLWCFCSAPEEFESPAVS